MVEVWACSLGISTKHQHFSNNVPVFLSSTTTLVFTLSLHLHLLYSAYVSPSSPSPSLADIKTTGSGELEFEEFVQLAAKFLIEEDEEALRAELKEAFRIYDREGESTNVAFT